jgi:uncharacterized membrane protein YeaQ/YmgE (transglycosylase-associated protein family)
MVVLVVGPGVASLLPTLRQQAATVDRRVFPPLRAVAASLVVTPQAQMALQVAMAWAKDWDRAAVVVVPTALPLAALVPTGVPLRAAAVVVQPAPQARQRVMAELEVAVKFASGIPKMTARSSQVLSRHKLRETQNDIRVQTHYWGGLQVIDWATEIKRILPMIAGVTVMLIVTKPKDTRSAMSGLAVGLLVSYFVGDWLITVAGFQPGTSTAASFITAFAGNAIAVRAADYLQTGKLPFIGGRNEPK